MHLVNGALFGAVYANVAPRDPAPALGAGPPGRPGRAARHLAAGLGRRPRPSRARRASRPSPATRAAFAQATWRQLLFGFVLGELERRLNAPEPEAPSLEDVFSSNGHGSLEHAAPAVS